MFLLIKYIHLFIGLIFICFVYLQFNDSDTLLWSLIYCSVAATALLAFLEKYKKQKLSIILARIFFVPVFLYMVFNINLLTSWLQAGRPAFIDYEKTDVVEVENIREFLGLLISLLTLGFYALRRQ